MRKLQKKQVEDFLLLLEQVHNKIEYLVQSNRFQDVCKLLEESIEGISLLKKLIISADGEKCITISYLEEYVLSVRCFHKFISKTMYFGNSDLEIKNQEYTKQLNYIEQLLEKSLQSVRNDISIRKEVVFLPYKASMWDSLESVWKAADEDVNCDAYVIPIPYFDKNSDGSFGEMHYEGDLYPENVPVISYREYDFEERKPDMIFIHNPYDEYNIVTSVHPQFYSKNLKKYTSKLIYIPYFVLGEVKPEKLEAVEDIKHFCLTPGVFYADRTIVQSEDMRQVYINVLSEHFGEYTRRQWEEKISGIGSPKMDKVFMTKKENLEIPKEWIHIIQKKDGSWKKIIFYNTSIGALLQHDEKMLDKIESVLQIFKEHRDETALLWRPHPLVQTTIQSMRPKLWKRYEDIVQKYKKEEWGIYDNTADMNRAIALSDGYYGDLSSIVQLYQETGKAVMIQNVEVK